MNKESNDYYPEFVFNDGNENDYRSMISLVLEKVKLFSKRLLR